MVALETQICAVVAWWKAMAERRRQRRDLARLDERLLRDIGVGRFDAEVEIRKPFWR